MKKITAPTLQEALSQAALEFGCSVTELEYEVIQYESSGFLGLFKKPATIVVSLKDKPHATAPIPHAHAPQNAALHQPTQATNQEFFNASEFFKDSPETTQIFQTKDEIIAEISAAIEEMLSFMPYKIHTIQVSFCDPQTLYIFLDGADSALLIGERGYRYKALSYLLFNWIQPTYGYNIRLEIAQFLQNQEEAIEAYLVGIINEVRREGKAQTKPLDGILAFIALKKLRDTFPDKYISFRQNTQNERYIVINDFYR